MILTIVDYELAFPILQRASKVAKRSVVSLRLLQLCHTTTITTTFHLTAGLHISHGGVDTTTLHLVCTVVSPVFFINASPCDARVNKSLNQKFSLH
jgi:hypothetical protein